MQPQMRSKVVWQQHRSAGSVICGLICALAALAVLLLSPGTASAAQQLNRSYAGKISSLIAEHQGQSGAYVLEKGEEALLARAWLTEYTAKTIDIQYFIWSSDNVGILASEALLCAADRGVKVRVLVDDLLVDAPPQSLLALALHPNVDIRIYNPQLTVGKSKLQKAFNALTGLRKVNQRMHDKSAIFDSRIAITGGRNMADEYFDFNQTYNFRDRDILLIGPVAGKMEHNFNSFWHSPLAVPVEKLLKPHLDQITPEKQKMIYQDLHSYAANPENFAPEVRQALTRIPQRFDALVRDMVWGQVRFIHDQPGKNSQRLGFGGGGRTTDALAEQLRQARKSVTIQSPYLIMPKGALKLFRSLIERGVEVRIVTNSLASTDNLQAFSGYSKQRKQILKSGIKVYEFKPSPAIARNLIERYPRLKDKSPVFAIHAKSMVIDGTTLFIGTFNLDPRSANLNTEIGVLISNQQMAGQVEQNILRDMAPENSWNAADNPDRFAPADKRRKLRLWKSLPLEPLL